MAIPDTIAGLPVTSIGVGAFEYSRLTSVTIGTNVTSIGTNAFLDCTSLSSITIPASVSSIEQDAFRDCLSLANLTIPNGVSDIGIAAFYGCSGLTSVTIPASVTNIGYGVFEECYLLTAITVDTDNPFYSSVNGVLFDKDQTTLIEFPDAVGGSYTIPNSITQIGNHAFSGCRLTTVTMDTNIISLGDYAFGAAGA